MSSRSHHSRRSGSRRHGRGGSSLTFVWMLAALVVAYLIFVFTADPPAPDAPPRNYPGSAREVHSKVLPKNAREASEEFHRSYDQPEEVADEGDPVAESRRRNREEAERQANEHREQKLDKNNPPVQKSRNAEVRTTKAKPAPKEKREKKK